MKVAIAQIAPHLGDVKKNYDLHLDLAETARKKKVDLIIFPELSLTGYNLRDFVPDLAMKPETDPLFKKLKTLSREISLVVGFVEEKDRGLFFNSASFLAQGKIIHIHRKVFLPNYSMFEELRFFGQGHNFNTFLSPFGKTGMQICYDFLHYSASYLLFVGGAELVIVISAAPGRGTSQDEGWETSYMWELMGKAMSRFSQAFYFYANRVGIEDGKSFAGGSFIYNPAGQLIAKASYTEEELLIKDIDLKEIREIRKKWPYKRDEKPEVVCAALKRIISTDED